jgi:hypothetical protein
MHLENQQVLQVRSYLSYRSPHAYTPVCVTRLLHLGLYFPSVCRAVNGETFGRVPTWVKMVPSSEARVFDGTRDSLWRSDKSLRKCFPNLRSPHRNTVLPVLTGLGALVSCKRAENRQATGLNSWQRTGHTPSHNAMLVKVHLHHFYHCK